MSNTVTKGNYWVKGCPKHTPNSEVIHHFDSLEEAIFFKGQILYGTILDWGDGVNLPEEVRL